MSIEKTIESINYTNWYSKFIKSGAAVGETPTGVDPNVELRIVTGLVSSGGSISYSDFLINQDLTSFEFNTEVFWSPALSTTGGDYYQITFGSTMRLTIMFQFWTDYNIGNALSGAGVYILNSSNTPVFKSTTSPGPKGPGSDQWFPVRIIYNKNSANTWTVIINGTTVLTYNDPNAQTWQQVANNKGVTVAAHSGGGFQMSLFLRKLGLVYNAMFPILTATTSTMPQKFYPSADDSTFSSNRAAYARTLYPRITNVATAAQITKQKLVYNRHDASSRMERLKLQAIGQSSMRLKETEKLQFKAPNVNDVREALSRTRAQGYVVPPKCQQS